jgi:spermidine/putrescine ABC transporter ATP-binding subunit
MMSKDPASRGKEGRALVVEGLTKRYAGREVVRNLSFTIEAGEFFTLLGPSGCGKTTVLMSVAGFVAPDSGRVLLDGTDVTRRPPERRGIGVVFQNYALFPHMSVVDNVAYPLKVRGWSRRDARRRATEALQTVELDRLTDAMPDELSGGQKQRVALARALVFDPLLLLMDEPLSALDRRMREVMQFELRHMQARIGATVLYVTHDQEEAMALSDRIAVMNNGTFEHLGAPQDVYSHPTTSFVARFLGDSNSFLVRLVDQSDAVALVALDADPSQRFRVARSQAIPELGQLIVRPEHIDVGRETMSGSDRSGVEVTITDVAFLGSTLRLEADGPGGTRWTARIRPSLELLDRPPEPGQATVLHWSFRQASVVR